MASTRHRATRPNPSHPSPEDPARTRSPSILRDVDRSPRLRSAPDARKRKKRKKEEKREKDGRRFAKTTNGQSSSSIPWIPEKRANTRACEFHVSSCICARPTFAGLSSFSPPREGVTPFETTPDINNDPVESVLRGSLTKTRRNANQTNRARLSRRSKGSRRSLELVIPS